MPNPMLSIRRIGLKKHLNDTAEKHNGYAYDDFVKMVTSEVNVANLARVFNVDPRTVMNWLEVYQKELDER